MTDRVAYPLLDRALSVRGWVRVGQQGEMLIELDGAGNVGLSVSDAAEFAVALLKRARPEFRLFELSELAEMRDRLEMLLEES